jgi:hypothetical protein
MSTTSLFVEILVIGVQASVWLALMLSTGADMKPVLKFLTDYKEYAALITTVLLSMVYALGIIIDRLADSVWSHSFHSGRERFSEPVGKTRLRVLHKSENMAKFLDYQRSRLRIARSTIVNLTMTIVAGAIWMLMNSSMSSVNIAILISGLIALALAVIAMRQIDKAQMDRLEDAYNIITEPKKE